MSLKEFYLNRWRTRKSDKVVKKIEDSDSDSPRNETERQRFDRYLRFVQQDTTHAIGPAQSSKPGHPINESMRADLMLLKARREAARKEQAAEEDDYERGRMTRNEYCAEGPARKKRRFLCEQ